MTGGDGQGNEACYIKMMINPVSLFLAALLAAMPALAQTDPLEEQIDEAIERAQERTQDRESRIGDPVNRVLERLESRAPTAEDAAEAESARIDRLSRTQPRFDPDADPLEAFDFDVDALKRSGIEIDQAATARYGAPVLRPVTRDTRTVPRERFLEQLDRTFRPPQAEPAQPGGYVAPNTGFITPPEYPLSPVR